MTSGRLMSIGTEVEKMLFRLERGEGALMQHESGPNGARRPISQYQSLVRYTTALHRSGSVFDEST